jgi:UDP-N-acetylmuramyl pentapeptide synthase
LAQERKLSREERKKYIGLRRSFNKPVIGITGNLGKTSTLEMLRTILASRGKVLKSGQGYGNWKNNINTLEKLNSEYAYALFEFDYQRGNNFAEILRLIKPTIGIVTNIGDAHLNYLSSMMKVALQKSEVVKYLTRGGLAILNKDDELCSSLVDYIPTKNVIKYGLSHNADYFASDVKQLGPKGIKFKLNGKYSVSLPLYSIQDVYNFLAATASAVNMDFQLEEIIDIFQNKFQMAKGRGRLHRIDNYYLLDESYIATPRSLSKAARSLIGFKPYTKKLVFIVGDMTGAGVNVEDQHLNMGYFLSALPIDCLITVGDYAKYIAKGASLISSKGKKIFSVNTIDEILGVLEDGIEDKAAISIKGIGSVATHRIIKYLQKR